MTMPLNDEREITVVPSGDFRVDPSRYLSGVDQRPIRIVSASGEASLTVMGVADLDEQSPCAPAEQDSGE